ncbi:hypothetical protein [aff. Roholtiella sp. LEGE 12411]|nr:hypothetical protein [aff. Roholtiella sp. LEGE 12411]
MRRLITIWVDGGDRGKDLQHWVIDVYRWILNNETCCEFTAR